MQVLGFRDQGLGLRDVLCPPVEVPDKQEFHPTTSWLFKRDLARYFCGRSPKTLKANGLPKCIPGARAPNGKSNPQDMQEGPPQ